MACYRHGTCLETGVGPQAATVTNAFSPANPAEPYDAAAQSLTASRPGAGSMSQIVLPQHSGHRGRTHENENS